ncbi:Uncharacterised protein [Paenibacillus macerans]|nr:Uncharacterised protein [Paenibacillus macerans]
MQEKVFKIVDELRKIENIDRSSLARFIQSNPDAVPELCTSAGLGQEQLKNQLRHHLGTQGWVTKAKQKPEELIEFLDSQFNLVNVLKEEMARSWTYSDVLLERHLWSKKSGAQSVGRGRTVEDEVENLVQSLGLPYQMRTRFIGRGGETAPCDLAIPSGGDQSMIVIGMKGFNSTGSKLTDAVVEIEKMASVRLPRQYVYAVIDGIGWLSRQADLRRIFTLWETQAIDGLFTLKHLDLFKEELRLAASRLGFS